MVLRKYSKKIMAILGVFLMIAFVAELGMRGRQRSGRSGSDVIGRIGSDTIFGLEYDNARAEWETLTKELRFIRPGRGPDGKQQFDYFSYAEWELIRRINAAYPQNPMIAVMGARRITSQIDATTFMLLLREAKKMDVHPSRDAVQEALTALQGEVPGGDPVLRENSVTDWLTIIAAYDRIAAAPKVTPAESLRFLARQQQEISLQLVEFRAEDFMRDVPEPTKAQLEEFFNKYRNDNPDTSESGFGYRYPNRVRVQYMRIPREKLKATLTLEDTYSYFRNDPGKFEIDPTTQELAKLPLAERWKRLPDAAKDRVKNEIAQQMTEQMASAIRQRFAADWPNFHMAARTSGTTIPTEIPNTALGVPYNSMSYLIRVREQVQRLKESRGVMPETAEEGQLLSLRQLADLPGIGQAACSSPAMSNSWTADCFPAFHPLALPIANATTNVTTTAAPPTAHFR